MIPTSHGFQTPEGIVDDLNYTSYHAQRSLHGMTAERCKRLWPKSGDAFEARYQSELPTAGNDHATAASGDAPTKGSTHQEAA